MLQVLPVRSTFGEERNHLGTAAWQGVSSSLAVSRQAGAEGVGARSFLLLTEAAAICSVALESS